MTALVGPESAAIPHGATAAWVEALAATATIAEQPHRLLCHLIEDQAKASPQASALLSERESFAFAELGERIEAYASWAVHAGLGKGDRVALMMSNRPEFVAIWLGLSKVGVVTALINTNLTGHSLAHCLELAQPSQLIIEGQFAAPLTACNPAWAGETPGLWCHGKGPQNFQRIDAELADIDRVKPPALPSVTIDDAALLIYTSGTTGLPKAANVSHRRVLNWALWFKGLLGNTEADRMYNCLPLYHSVGGVVAVAATLVAGGSTVIAEKFSASRFWSDLRRWNCTQFQYIGELCRYLLHAPPGNGDGQHGVRLICGNGLRADVWKPFQERFNVPRIVEFYAATEGNFSLYNVEGKPGSIGRIPPFLKHHFPIKIVKFDAETSAPPRGPDGFCQEAAIGEAGEAIGRIGDASARFEGYTDPRESEGKILRDVFAKGDRWFRSGDLMRIDAAGYAYFVDRAGDTFRWKGENVSTLEVANRLLSAPGLKDAVVYGVNVPGADGKAGMALLTVSEEFDLEKLCRHAEAELPAYAMPLFLRIGTPASLTETFKHKKQDLVHDGFNPARTADKIYLYARDRRNYRQIDGTLYKEICSGKFRL
jgi:fatty-acyl-CoA synthase